MQMKLEFHQKSTRVLDAPKFLWNWEENYFCQRSSIGQALARCFLAISFISDSCCPAYLTAGETKTLKDIQLASGRGEANPDVSGPGSLFTRGLWSAFSHSATNVPGTFWDYISQGGSLSVIPGCLYLGICLLAEYTVCCYETPPKPG